MHAAHPPVVACKLVGNISAKLRQTVTNWSLETKLFLIPVLVCMHPPMQTTMQTSGCHCTCTPQ